MSNYKEIIVKEYHNEKGLLTRREVGEELVRCKDCIHNDQCKHRVVMWVEDPINTWHKDIDFCSYGEREEQERNIFLDESIDETAGYGEEQEHE